MKAFLDKVNDITESVTFFMFAVLIVIGGLQVFNRFVISKPLTWSEEVTKILFIYIVFLGASMALRKGAFAIVDVVHDRVPPKLRFFLDLFNAGMIVVFMVVFIKLGLQICAVSVTQVTPALQMPQAVVYAAVPIGCFLMLLTAIELLLKMFGKGGTTNENP